ncbi:hypothetical protein, partial [Litorisediminicola beolgyonensis]
MPSVQLFSFDIDTSDQTAINTILAGHGVDPADLSEEESLTLQANLQRDMIKAHVAPHVAHDVLPVFLAPEFFFKRADTLPYRRDTFFNIQPYLNTISASFPEVLWCLGTVWWQEPQKSGQAMVHNSALILQNGRLLHSWQKERLSQIDGLRRGPEIWDRHDVAEARVLEASQDPFFTAAVPGGATVAAGIEICLDHLTLDGPPVSPGVLRTHYLNAHPTGHGAGVDLHILTAAGMPVQPENIVSRDGGVFLRCDGGGGANPRIQALGVTRTGATPAAALRAWSPT